MAKVSAAAVKALRDKTLLPMLDCKKALEETGGDEQAAIEILRKAGAKTAEKRMGKSTAFGRYGLFADLSAAPGALVELRCESAPVAGSADFVQLANDLARRLATGPGAATPEDLLAQPSPSREGATLKDQFDELNNQIRELFKLERIIRVDGPCAGYVHHDGAKGVLLQVDGDNAALAKDICMHIVAMRPQALSPDELDPAEVEKEREILSEAARQSGKPDNIVAKIVEGQIRSFYSERCLLEQEFVKDSSKTVGQIAQEGGLTVRGYTLWELSEE